MTHLRKNDARGTRAPPKGVANFGQDPQITCRHLELPSGLAAGKSLVYCFPAKSMKNRIVFQVILGFLLSLTYSPISNAQTVLSQPKYGIVVTKNVMISMRDGVKLACDIYRPTIDGKPVDGKFP